ncbi:MAG: EamA family transporter RarD [Blastomonas sp.]
MNATPETQQPSGLPAAIAAYLAWGFLPLYFKILDHVANLEILAQRVIWALPVCIVIMLFRRQIPEYLVAFRDRRLLLLLCASSTLIAINWLVYIIAVNSGHILASSLGYYLNPLVNVLLGTLFLKERLSRMQLLAVAIAASGVALLLGGALDTLWISLTLALSFGSYGLIRKVMPLGSLPGLAMETTLLMPFAAALAIWFMAYGEHPGMGLDWQTSLLLAAGGPVTAVPLLLFAVAARRMTYAALGFVQFLAPSIAFILGWLVYREPLDTTRLVCFVLIWIAIAIFSFDIWQRSRKVQAAA